MRNLCTCGGEKKRGEYFKSSVRKFCTRVLRSRSWLRRGEGEVKGEVTWGWVRFGSIDSLRWDTGRASKSGPLWKTVGNITVTAAGVCFQG